MSLTLRIDPPFGNKTKIAAAKYLLGDNSQAHESEILAQLYKQHPYLGKYAINIEIKHSNPERGYILGVVSVNPQGLDPASSALPQEQRPTRDMEEADSFSSDIPGSLARIPLIVKARALSPFDIFIDANGKFQPLNETRLASTAFSSSMYGFGNRQTMQAASSQDPFSANNFDSQMRGFNIRSVGLMGNESAYKLSSALAHVGVTAEDANAFFAEVGADPWLRYVANVPLIRTAYEKIASLSSEPARAPEVSVRCPVYAITKCAGGAFIQTVDGVTTASDEELAGVSYDDRPLLSVLAEESVILFSPPSAIGDVVAHTDEYIKTSGVYTVEQGGKRKTAAVVRGFVRASDGRRSDMFLVFSDSGVSVQDAVSGTRIGDLDTQKLASAKGGSPSGTGVFVFPSGELSELLTVNTTVRDGISTRHYASSAIGDHVLTETETDRPVYTKMGMLIPRNAKFVRLAEAPAASATLHIEKQASYAHTTLTATDEGFLFQGRAPDALGVSGESLPLPAAVFALGLLGADDATAKLKLAEALESGQTQFTAAPVSIEPVRHRAEFAVDGIRQAMIKEAATLLAASEPDSVDAVLSLNFITPDNVMRAVEALPNYESALSELCKLMIYVRTGMREVPEDAVASAVRGMTKAVDGLKRLQTASVSA